MLFYPLSCVSVVNDIIKRMLVYLGILVPISKWVELNNNICNIL